MNTQHVLSWLFTKLDNEQLFLAPADEPDKSRTANSLDEATQLIEDWKDRGAFFSTGTFKPETARKTQHLVSIPAIILDADIKDALAHEGMKNAEERVRNCSQKMLEKLRQIHIRCMLRILGEAGIETCSMLVFSGAGHHVYLLIDLEDQKDIGRIRATHKALVARLNRLAGWQLFDRQVVDAGTRYVRFPGSANLRCHPLRYSEIVSNSGPSYSIEQLAEAAGVHPVQNEPEPAKKEPIRRTMTRNTHSAIVELLEPLWTKGQRHEHALGLSGYLAKSGWEWKDVRSVLVTLTKRTNDEEIRDRLDTLRTTCTRLHTGERVTGYALLSLLLPAKVLRQLELIAGPPQLQIIDDLSQMPIRETTPQPPQNTRTYPEIQEGGKLTAARDFLQKILATGPRDREFLLVQAKAIGVSKSTLDRAGAELRISKTRTYSQNKKITGATWELPNE